MTKEKDYNWWTDPKNKEKVDRVSWWNHSENKDFFNFPISVVEDHNTWVAACNNETELLIGNQLQACAQGRTKEDAIRKMFTLIRMSHEYSEECRLNYQRWVPFRKGNWKHSGGRWFVIFGIHVYFRYGTGMKGGWYVPFTKLNISISSHWVTYRKWKKEQLNKRTPI